LGYLAEVEPENLDESLGRLIAGDYEIDERTVLAVTVNSSGPANGTWWALNEAVLEKEAPGRLVHIGIEINKAFFTTYAADGVVIATSTGSTAYSFSAGGPIASPQHECILLTPVSPHMLFDRSLILGTQEEIKCTITDDRGVVIITDGREIGRLTMGDSVVCTGADKPVRMITLGTRDFHQILKAKFGLADR
jgi:NAD+ kinase